MNIVKQFFQGAPVDSIEHSIMIPQGQLYLVRTPNSPKSENECLCSTDVIISLKDHMLVVWRADEDDDDDDDDTRDAEAEDDGQFTDSSILETFNLKENSLICLFERYKQKIITWRDLEGDFGDMYEYRISSNVSYDTIDQFMLAIYKSLYELKYDRSSDDVQLEELQEFVVKRSDIELYMVPDTIESDACVSGGEGDSDDDYIEDSVDDLFVDADDNLESKVTTGSTLNKVPCKLSMFNASKNVFKLTNGACEAVILKLDDWKYMLEILECDKSDVLVQIFINEDIYPEFIPGTNSFVFNQITLKGVHVWKVSFRDDFIFNGFKAGIARAIWETKNHDSFPENGDYLIDTFDAMDISDDEGEEESEPEVEESTLRDYKLKNEIPSDDDGEYNTGLKVGLNTDRAFVSRGDKLGVFKADDELEFVTSITNISSKDAHNGEHIQPSKMMLMNGDSTMILQDEKNLNLLHSLDLTKGKVVQDWKMSKDGIDRDIKVFTTNAKLSGAQKEDTFLGGTSQAIFRIDQRVKNGFISNDEFKEYKTKLGITAIVTTLNGMIAIAAKDGSIKLYDTLGKNAKTALPPLGDEIFSLDVTLSGRYLIATCKNYLLLIDLKIKNGKFAGDLGFNRSFPVDSKPEPGRLRLQPGHMASLMKLYGKDIEFTPAKFDIGSRTIMSSVGRYSFIWDLKSSLNGNQYPVKIREYNDKVIMGDFAHHVDQVLVTMKNDVALTSRNAFNDPNDAFTVKRLI